ncbi:TPA: NAD(P)-binding protein [Campylobacter jejuni]|nr:NAD(P)-binding protein [Campylobacter jejuni]
MSDIKKVLVVGAGLSGCSIARLLVDTGKYEVCIIEKSESIGGNCKDALDENGNLVSKYGPHIFHTNNEEVLRFFYRFSNGLTNDFFHKVRAFLIENGCLEYITMPINLDSLKNLLRFKKVPNSIIYDIENYLKSHYIGRTNFQSLKDCPDNVNLLYEILLECIYEPYTLKQWGVVSLQELDNDIFNRVPIYLDKVDGYFRDNYQLYPDLGYSTLIKSIVKDIPIMFNMDFNTYIKAFEEYKQFDKIIYTGSIDELFNYTYGKLPYRSVAFRYVYDEKCNSYYYANDSFVTNFPGKHFKYTRIANYKFLNKYLGYKDEEECNKAPIVIEYPIEASLNNRSYPIRNTESLNLYNKYVSLSEKEFPNMKFLGRLGSFRYLDMDKAIEQSFELYKQILTEDILCRK